jgi:hypothetical protein
MKSSVVRRSTFEDGMAEMGHKQTFDQVGTMSALPPKADIVETEQ